MPKLSLCNTNIQPVPTQHTRKRADSSNCQRRLIIRTCSYLHYQVSPVTGWEGTRWVRGSPLEWFFSAKFAPCLVRSQTGRNQPTASDRGVTTVYRNNRMENIDRQQFYYKMLYIWIKTGIWVNNEALNYPPSSLQEKKKRQILNVQAGGWVWPLYWAEPLLKIKQKYG